MTINNSHRIFVSAVLVVLLLGLARFGEGYNSLGIVFSPLILWLNLKREPEQREIRPAIRMLGWIFVSLATAAMVWVGIAIAFGR